VVLGYIRLPWCKERPYRFQEVLRHPGSSERFDRRKDSKATVSDERS